MHSPFKPIYSSHHVVSLAAPAAAAVDDDESASVPTLSKSTPLNSMTVSIRRRSKRLSRLATTPAAVPPPPAPPPLLGNCYLLLPPSAPTGPSPLMLSPVGRSCCTVPEFIAMYDLQGEPTHCQHTSPPRSLTPPSTLTCCAACGF